MSEIIEKSGWREFLEDFSTLHKGEQTRLGVFEMRDGVVSDLWLEDGLPLVDIDVDTKDGRHNIGLVFEHFRHSIDNASTVTQVSGNENIDGIDIEDDEGKTTALRFEDYAVENED